MRLCTLAEGSMNVRADRFPLVDSLRAIAALAIVGYHAAYFSRALEDVSAVQRLATNFQAGVTIFFLISAFLLYRPFARARLRGEPPPLTGAYAWRRFLRITPAYWVALTIAGLLGFALSMSASKLPAYYGFAQIYSPNTSFGGLPQAWTLCVEVTFYAFLPLWALLMRALPPRGGRSWLRQELGALALLFVASQAYKLVLALTIDLTSTESIPLLQMLPNFLDQFALGMAIAVLSVWVTESEASPRSIELLDRHSWASWALAAAAFALAVALVGPTGQLGHVITRSEFLVRHELWTVVALGIALPAMLGDGTRGLVRRLLSGRRLVFLGLVSYGIFLQHLTVMTGLERLGFEGPGGTWVRWVAWALVGGTGAVLAGAASYYVIERPALRLKRLVPARRRDAEGEALAESAPLSPPEPAGGSAGPR